MKKLLSLLICLVIAFAMLGIVGCKDDSSSDSDSPSSSDTTSGDSSSSSGDSSSSEITLSGVEMPAFVTEFKANSGKKGDGEAEKQTEFFVLNKTYKVGDYNEFFFKPVVSYVNEDFEPVKPENEDFGYTLELKTDIAVYTLVDGDDYLESFDNKTCGFDFKPEAIGKTFRINVSPALNGEQAAEASEYTKSLEVEIVSGYNVYTTKEFGYLNNFDLRNSVDAASGQAGWAKFRADNGFTLTNDEINALKGLVIHNDLVFEAKDIPASFMYTADEISAINKNYVGTLKDEVSSAIFFRDLLENETFDVYGNYFMIDTHKMPYTLYSSGFNMSTVFDENGEVVSTDIISHVTFIKMQGHDTANAENTSCSISDVNVLGNSPRTADVKAQGGLIFLKNQYTKFALNNSISKCFFITGFCNYSFGKTEFNDLKCYDSFNSPLYNWGCDSMYLNNVEIKGAGGPAIIADMTDSNGGSCPRIIGADCVFDNPVSGDEAWFVMAQASTLIGQFKALDALPRMISAESTPDSIKSFCTTGKNNDGTTYSDRLNIYVIVKNEGGAMTQTAGKNKTYVEINGAVLDYGVGSVKPTDKSNSPDKSETGLATYKGTLAYALQTACAQGAPVLETNAGGAIYFDGTASHEILNMTNILAGDTLNIYYDTKTLFGQLGVMVEYYTNK